MAAQPPSHSRLWMVLLFLIIKSVYGLLYSIMTLTNLDRIFLSKPNQVWESLNLDWPDRCSVSHVPALTKKYYFWQYVQQNYLKEPHQFKIQSGAHKEFSNLVSFWCVLFVWVSMPEPDLKLYLITWEVFCKRDKEITQKFQTAIHKYTLGFWERKTTVGAFVK